MKIVRSNLKALLDERGISIRKFTEISGLKYETVRRLYNDDTRQYQRDTLAVVCETLNVGIDDVLTLIDDEKTEG
ncbi:putative transcriptional regulator [Chryseomicrobium aureum]|uniref:helix-turn-helix domain-containing protein n=1 Tax=Chryseomicrobium aureum TaxID=1441723 RepID=UPI001EF802F6|nr:helix-turn-helix transcriptional regulator [Chryseomicrobium aureum]MBM7707595.1 putative transcriptional regulator [Chryseomicrobium aureum]